MAAHLKTSKNQTVCKKSRTNLLKNMDRNIILLLYCKRLRFQFFQFKNYPFVVNLSNHQQTSTDSGQASQTKNLTAQSISWIFSKKIHSTFKPTVLFSWQSLRLSLHTHGRLLRSDILKKSINYKKIKHLSFGYFLSNRTLSILIQRNNRKKTSIYPILSAIFLR